MFLRISPALYASMWPTLVENDLVRCDYFFWGRKRIARNDIVAFAPPSVEGVRSKTKADFHVKRVIGIPGDRIEVIPGVGVSLNGQILNEQNYVANKAEYALKCLADIGGMMTEGESVRPYFLSNTAPDPIIVPAGHYFLLGDNRNVSVDSHVYGFIEERLIRARIYSLRSRDLRAKQISWKCTFCSASQSNVKFLMQGLGGYICTDCLSALSTASAQIPEVTARCTLCLSWRDAKQIRFSAKVSGGRACAECLQTALEAQRPYLESSFETGKLVDWTVALSHALTFLHYGEPQQAVAFARMAAEQKPDEARPLTILCSALIAANEPAEAVEIARRAAELPDTTAATKLMLVHALIAAERIDEAESACNAVLDRHPASSDAFALRSVVYIRQRKFAEALTDARRVLGEEPDTAGMHANVGYCQLELGNLDEATHAIDRALYCNVRLGPAYRTRGRIRMARKQYFPAVEDFSLAIKLEPKKGEYRALRASAYRAMGETELAEADLQKARELGWHEESAAVT
jgi:signal peptidase I